jgi:hypothetical protein
MGALGRSLIARAYRRLRSWLEAIAEREAAEREVYLAPGVLAFHPFLLRLREEIERAERYSHEMGLVVFHLLSTSDKGKQRLVEIALRDTLRRSDICGRLSDHLLGVILPETGQAVTLATERIARLLSETAGGPVGSGFARFPDDGKKASELLRVATKRSEAEPLSF